MPKDRIPKEIMDDWERIYNRLKKENPDWDEERVAKTTWSVIKKIYKKQNGKWVKIDKGVDANSIDLYKIEMYEPYLDKVTLATWQDAVSRLRSLEGSDDVVTMDIDNLEIVDYESVAGNDLVKAQLENKRPEDYIIVKGVLATSRPYVNGNRDSFEKEDLVAAYEEGQFQGLQIGVIDWNHNFLPFGAIVDMYVRDEKVVIDGKAEDVKQLVFLGVFWRWLYPYEGDLVRDWYNAGMLKFSMAAKARGGYKCGDCGAVSTDRVCEHLEKGTYSERIILNPYFYAVTIVPIDKVPADKNAVALDLATQKDDLNGNNNSNYGGDHMKEQLEKLTNELVEVKAQLSEKEKEINDLNERIKALEKEKEDLAKAVEEKAAEIDSLNQKVDELNGAVAAKDDELKEKETVIAEMREKIESYMNKEVEMINASIKEKLQQIPGMSDENVEFWYSKFKAEIVEGEVKFEKDEFEKWLENIPVVTATQKKGFEFFGSSRNDTDSDLNIDKVL